MLIETNKLLEQYDYIIKYVWAIFPFIVTIIMAYIAYEQYKINKYIEYCKFDKDLNRAYLLESQVAIYPRVIYDNEIVMSFIQEYDRRQKTNRDADGIFYIDIFKSLSVLQEELGVIDNIRTAILNYWSKTIYDVEFKEINSIIGKPKTKNTNYKYLQKLYWLITVYEKWCENSNKKEYKLPMPLKDIDTLLVWEGNCYYD